MATKKTKKTLIGVALALFVGGIIFNSEALPAESDKTFTLVMESVYPENHNRVGQRTIVGQWLDEVEKESGGRIKFERHWAGEPVPSKEALNALSRGLIDILSAAPTYYSGQVAIADVLLMPKNFRSFVDFYDLWWNSQLGDLIDKVYQEKANVKFLVPALFAPENFQISKRSKKIRTFEDFKGLKIRAPGGMAVSTVKRIGASPVMTIGGDYYTAMQRGTIDAGLMTSYSLESYKMWEVCDQVVNPPVFNSCMIANWINRDKWNELGPELQKIMIDSWRRLETKFIAFVHMDEIRIEKLGKSHGVEFFTLPEAEQEKMWEAVTPVWDDYVDVCTQQGNGEEAKQIRAIVSERFEAGER